MDFLPSCSRPDSCLSRACCGSFLHRFLKLLHIDLVVPIERLGEALHYIAESDCCGLDKTYLEAFLEVVVKPQKKQRRVKSKIDEQRKENPDEERATGPINDISAI